MVFAQCGILLTISPVRDVICASFCHQNPKQYNFLLLFESVVSFCNPWMLLCMFVANFSLYIHNFLQTFKLDYFLHNLSHFDSFALICTCWWIFFHCMRRKDGGGAYSCAYTGEEQEICIKARENVPFRRDERALQHVQHKCNLWFDCTKATHSNASNRTFVPLIVFFVTLACVCLFEHRFSPTWIDGIEYTSSMAMVKKYYLSTSSLLSTGE